MKPASFLLVVCVCGGLGAALAAAGDPVEAVPSPRAAVGVDGFAEIPILDQGWVPNVRGQGGPGGDGKTPPSGAQSSDGSDEPRIEGLRAIQYSYSPNKATVILEWRVVSEHLDSLKLSVDGALPRALDPDIFGVRVEKLAVGRHHYQLEGRHDGQLTVAAIIHEALAESPLDPVTLRSCVSYGFGDDEDEGMLQVVWDAPARPAEDPYIEFELWYDGRFLRRMPAASSVASISDVEEGVHEIRVFGVTREYLSPPLETTCRAMWVPAPTDLKATAGECTSGTGAVSISFRVPRFGVLDAIAVWVTSYGGRSFHGCHKPDTGRIQLVELPAESLTIELAGARIAPGAEDAFALSNMPGKPGAHATVKVKLACAERDRFRRGDARNDSRVNMTDAIVILQNLFVGGAEVLCPAALDVDDNGAPEITDAIRLLGFLFSGGQPPARPGPFECGNDPTPDAAGGCLDASCADRE